MDTLVSAPAFADPALGELLATLETDALDALDFGVIGFDASGEVCLYNRYESELAGLGRARVVGKRLFTEVAPCMNNFMVAERFRTAAASGDTLDVTIDYVFTLRMRPTRVALRLLSNPGTATSYVLVRRRLPRAAG
jgi:photoactive yellow protein